MGEAIDMTGQVFTRLTVLKRVANRSGKAAWLCKCECGNETVKQGTLMRRGDSRSCGCLARELSVARFTTHGMKQSPEYYTWVTMKDRCCNPRSKHHARYGSRGIKICTRWLDSFENFFEDMGLRPEGLSLDRIDNEGDYSPENCRWATPREQANNRRNTARVEFNGQAYTMARLARRFGIKVDTLRYRLQRGMTVTQALTTPVLKRRVN